MRSDTGLASKGMTVQAAINIDILNSQPVKHLGQVLSAVWKQLKMEAFPIWESLWDPLGIWTEKLWVWRLH